MNGKLKTFIADSSLVYVAAIWGSTFIVVKDAVGNIDPVALVAHRFILAAAVMLIVSLLLKKNPFSNIREGGILGFFMFMMYIPQTVGIKYTAAANSGFITGLFIMFVPIVGFLLFREIPSIMKTIAVIVAVSGLYILTGGIKDMNIGDIVTLITALACALHILVADKFMKKDMDPYAMSFQQFAVTGVLSYITAFVFGIDLKYNSADMGLIILFLALFPTVSGFLIQMAAQRFTSSIKVAAIFSLEPVFAAIFAWTIGGELFSVNGAVGGFMIVAAMIMAELPIGKANAEPVPAKPHGEI